MDIKSIRCFFEYIKKDTALKYPSKAVHIIHMMGEEIFRSTSKIVEWEKKKRAKRTKNVLQCPMC